MVVVFVDREHHHLHAGMGRLEQFDGLGPLHPRQPDIHQHDVYVVAGERVERTLGIAVGTDAREPVGAVDEIAQPLTDLGAVLDDGDADHLGWLRYTHTNVPSNIPLGACRVNRMEG